MFRKLSIRFLKLAEYLYLRSHGWEKTEEGWDAPAGYPFKNKQGLAAGHAVNSQKVITYNPQYKHLNER